MIIFLEKNNLYEAGTEKNGTHFEFFGEKNDIGRRGFIIFPRGAWKLWDLQHFETANMELTLFVLIFESQTKHLLQVISGSVKSTIFNFPMKYR